MAFPVTGAIAPFSGGTKELYASRARFKRLQFDGQQRHGALMKDGLKGLAENVAFRGRGLLACEQKGTFYFAIVTEVWAR